MQPGEIGFPGGGERLAVIFGSYEMFLLNRIELMFTFEKSPRRWKLSLGLSLV
jgi:hypothetical protein